MISNVAKKRLFNSVRYLGIILGLIICLFPIYIMVTTSLKNDVDSFSIPPKWIFKPILTNYKSVLTEANFTRYFVNSIIVSVVSTFLSIGASALAAYSLARRNFFGKRIFAGSTFLMRMIPPVVLVIPIFIMFRNIGILDSLFSLILVYTALTMP